MKNLPTFIHNGDSPTKRKCIYSFEIRTKAVESGMSRLNLGESKLKIIDINKNLSKNKLRFFQIVV